MDYAIYIWEFLIFDMFDGWYRRASHTGDTPRVVGVAQNVARLLCCCLFVCVFVCWGCGCGCSFCSSCSSCSCCSCCSCCSMLLVWFVVLLQCLATIWLHSFSHICLGATELSNTLCLHVFFEKNKNRKYRCVWRLRSQTKTWYLRCVLISGARTKVSIQCFSGQHLAKTPVFTQFLACCKK